ncbi:MAG: quinone oxidoreductase [Rickettsiaceae bacterium H1]|nr:quinone oxidoreductase [Rickettsiaceae bacterium H1]
MKAIIVKQNGVIAKTEVKLSKLKDTEVLVANTFLGVNYFDIHKKKGLINSETIPTLGVEAIGKIENIGESVNDFKTGDRVGYCSLYGTYYEKRIIDSKHLIRIPDYIEDKIAAAVLFKGMIAHYLLKRAYIVQPSSTILVHDADSDIGQLICQWADYLKAMVIGTVTSDDRAEIALNNGCEYALNYQDEDCRQNIMEITNGRGVNAIYDSVGLKTCKLSFEVLTMFGIYVLYDETSGSVPPIDPKILKSRSTFFTNTSVFHYKSNQFEMGMTVQEIFQMVKRKYLTPKIAKIYNLDEIDQAHKDLEKKSLDGQLIIKV